MAHDLFLLCMFCIAVSPIVTLYSDGDGLEVQLVNGKTKFQGRLEVRRNESEPWGTVCDDGFDQNDAKVVCRMLNFTDTEYATYFHEPSPYGPGNGDVVLDNINCIGNETNLAQCNSSGWDVSNCHHNEDVGVNCHTPVRLIGSKHSGMVQIQSNGTWKPMCYDGTNESTGKVLCRMLALSAGNVMVKPGQTSNEVYYDNHPNCKGDEYDISQCRASKTGCYQKMPVDLNCRTEIRLQGGPHNQSGRVEVFFQNKWGTICDDSFESIEEPAASVICGMLGFKTKGAVHISRAFYGEGTGDVLIDKLECNGGESDIADCDSKQWGSHTNCRHSEDVSVECGTEVRLVGGPTPFSGRLEIYHGSQWKTMCDSSFNNRTAQVVCNMLGFTGGNVSVHGGAYYGQGAGEMVDYALNCYGNETDIVNCQHDIHSTRCNHSQDVGINCYSVTPIRLQGGPMPFSGRVEIWSYVQQNWTAVCEANYGFTKNDAKVLCTMMGKPTNSPTFQRANELYDYVILGKGIAYMGCKGTEKDITDCVSGRSWNQSTCDNPYYVGINCDPVTLIRLVDGNSSMTGRVEVHFNNTWGSVCWDGYESYLATVVCKMVGSSGTAKVLSSNEYRETNTSTVINWIDCSRYPRYPLYPDDISDCKATSWDINNQCASRTYVGIACESKVRLVNGTSDRSGRVEVLVKGSWKSVCASGFNLNAGNVVCRMIGLNVWNVSVLDGNYFGRGVGEVYLNSTNCTGQEEDLIYCRSGPWEQAGCEDDKVAAVDCQYWNTELRLVNSKTPYSGRVEVHFNNHWGTVCQNSFTEQDASVVCRTLGYNFSTNISVVADLYDGNFVSNQVIVTSLSCNGSEEDISMCSSLRWDSGYSSCSNSYTTYHSVGVNCLTSVRLSGGTEAMGQVEVNHGGTWRTVCNDNFVETNIPVLCFMLGFNYTQDYKKIDNRFHTSNADQPTIQNLTCRGTEEDIQLCRSDRWGMSSCRYRNAAAISCNTPIQLVGENNWYHGKLQIWSKDHWMDVCHKNNTAVQIGNLVCRMLGMKNGNVRLYQVEGGGGNNAFEASCSGNEEDISKCNLTRMTCPLDKRLAIHCEIGIKLENGRTEYMGVVLVNLFDQWGPIQTFKNEYAAKVACKTLGFKFWNKAEIQRSSDFRNNNSCIYSHTNIPVLDCTGNETDIMMCNNTYPYENSYTCPIYGVNCQTPVRLTNGSQYQYGRIEVKNNESWFPICIENFNIESAYVFCRMLGHKHAWNATFRREESTHYNGIMGAVKCNGSEPDISQCKYQWLETCPGGGSVHLDCRSSVRLVDSTKSYIGRVEVLYKGQWGTIGRYSSSSTATVKILCKMLGLNYQAPLAYNRPGAATTLKNQVTNHTINNLICIGTEEDITECKSSPWMSPDVYYDSGPLEIECSTPIELIGGATENVGMVQIRHNEEVLSVCGDNFTSDDAEVICRKIGAVNSQNASIYLGNKFGNPLQYSVTGLACSGDEFDIQDCRMNEGLSSPGKCNNTVGLNCRPVSTPIRIIGSTNSTGLVEIYFNGAWGTVCDDSFDYRGANVLCRMLGFKAGHFIGSGLRTVYDGILVDDLECTGTEKDVSECKSRRWNSHNCQHSEDVSIDCFDNYAHLIGGVNDYQGRVEFKFLGEVGAVCDTNFDTNDAKIVCKQFGFQGVNATIYDSERFGSISTSLVVDDLNCSGIEDDIDECLSYPWHANLFSCSRSDVGAGVNCRPKTPIRLVNGSNSFSGRLEIEYKGSYGTVCDREFDENDAKVVCRMMGFNTMSTNIRQRAFYGQGSGKVTISHLRCNGDENDISECSTSYRWDTPYANCMHSDDVSVQCDTPVRLHGGWTAFSGAVEIHINGSWESVCYKGFTQTDADTICNITRLAYNNERMSNTTIHKEGYYGIRSKTAHIGNIGCIGEEDDLFFCGSGRWTKDQITCNADDNVAINCRPVTPIRLMHFNTEVNLTSNGKSNVSGRVELNYNNKWGTICDDQFDDSDALVICKMIGFSVGHVDKETDHQNGKDFILVDDLECLGTEDDISECKAREWGTHNCDHSEDISVICDYTENIDPCKSTENVRIPHLETRYLNTLTSTLKSEYNDFRLPLAWYNVGKNAMPDKPDKPPEIGRCGTHFPIYSTDELPKRGDPPKSIKATQVGENGVNYDVLVKACNNGDYVYRLGPTRNAQSGYCFGIGSTDPPPTFIAKGVSTFIRQEQFNISFGCKFTPSLENLLYQVFWYIDGNYQHNLTKQYSDASNLHNLDLTDEDFETLGIGLGINIACAVRAFKSEDGQPGPMSEISPSIFAGIRVLTPSINLRKGESKSIELENTMPFVCDEDFISVCKIKLELSIPDYYSCSQTVKFESDACATTFNSSSLNGISTINIKTGDEGQYGVQGHFKINLLYRPNSEKKRRYIKFWKRQYKLPEISVNVLPEADKSWRGTLCTAQNDPHMHTFDGKPYEHHEQAGEYILYRHKLFDNVEIQHKIASCVGSNGQAKCNCGVAVRSGRDVYVINVCDRLLDIGYKRCQDESLTVKKNNDFTYTVYLPYGTAVRARIDSQPWMGNEGGRIVDISILPSVYDNGGNTSGLCGSLNNNTLDDFHHRNGSSIQSSDRNLFINSWRVREDESLFSKNVFDIELKPWSFPSCVCRETEQADVPVTCDRSATECAPGVTSGQHSCGGVSERRTRRSVDRRPRIPVVMQTDHYGTEHHQGRLKRDVVNKNLTARQQCEQYFQDLQAFKLCQKVPATHTNMSMENCVLDIELTNTTLWMTVSRQSMQDTCLTEIHRNASVREEVLNSVNNKSTLTNSSLTAAGTTIPPVQLAEIISEIKEIEKIVKEITIISCLNDCSGHGQCINGTCLCERNFGASDCSLDINKPPRISALLDNGLCDEKDHDCSHIYVFGEVFAGTNLTCRLESFTMMHGENNKTRDGSSTYTLKGVADSLIEAICPVNHLRSKRSTDTSSNVFVRGFRVSVSNDGTTFGNQTEDVYIFDSTCQTYDNASGEIIFSLKDGHCYINGRCVANGTVSISQQMVCHTGMSRFSWTPVTTKAPTTTTSTTTLTTTKTTTTKTSTTQMSATTTSTSHKEECSCISNNTKSCIDRVCVCKDGWTGRFCDNDVDECSLSNVCENKPNTTCQNTPGRFDCLCLRGFEKTKDSECKVTSEPNPSTTVNETVNAKPNLQAYMIELRIDLSINSSLNLNAASTYHMLEAAAKTALSAVYQRKLGIGFKDVIILSLRPGSLIVQHAVIATRDNFVTSAMSVAAADWSRGETLKMFDSVYHVDNVKIDNKSVGTNGGNLQNFLLCESHTALQPCAEDEFCVVEKDAPICKKKDTHSDSSNLITIISSSVGGVLVLVIVILVACLCRSKMNNRKGLNARQSSAAQNMYHDMNSTEMLERPRNKPEEGNEKTSAYNPAYDSRSITSEGSYYKDGYVYYFGKK